ncbi:uncharacterized protein F5891DRAFT_665013 [Suillus fuscotomentosus]|uniref:F-box domain-containing protein n=1 Tax=Suillus fuscotomentosus TaxID=1912939 RepID=A0AAD4HH85_9AGAM|nr:uncharacterized protein F5891DRAFT_665013 [Suillus fuscotomentosus]KAG1895409.1 hypothetical protein F5891DRAFT_665013 [Suillus fuscotomentosus]
MRGPFETLCISEILAVILDGLQGDKKSLYYMSCCCRAFTDPALDVLWRSMHSFAPFTSLIPQSASFANDSWTTDHDLLKYRPSNDWKTFDKYAARVRSLCIGDYINNIADLVKTQDCYTCLTVIRGQDGCHPFPKLRSLIYILYGPISPQAKPFPPSLRSLTLVCRDAIDCDPIELVLDRAVAEAPRLKELRIIGLMRTMRTLHPTPQPHFGQIESLDLSKAYIRAPELATLCTLLSQAPISDLKIHLQDRLDIDWDAIPPMFPALKQLDVRGSMSSVTLFMSRLAATNLHTLVFQPNGYFQGVVIVFDYLIPIIVKTFGKSLKSLDLHINGPRPRAEDSDVIKSIFQGLEPLMEAGLQSLRLFLQVGSTLRPVQFPPEVQSMLEPSAWPSLKHFHFATKE